MSYGLFLHDALRSRSSAAKGVLLLKTSWRSIFLIAFIAGSFAAMLALKPIAQPSWYHDFADRRTIAGIPNFVDVISNITFLAVGIAGLGYCLRSREEARISWSLFFLAVGLVFFGSVHYHLAPGNATLFWDRLPMAMGFMALLIGLYTELVNRNIERYLLLPAVLAGFGSVIWWRIFDDLRFYIWVQAIPLIALPSALLLYRSRYTRLWFLIVALFGYLLAKVFEVYDRQVYSLTGQLLSGHTLKHLFAALGCFFLYMMLKVRTRINLQDAFPRA